MRRPLRMFPRIGRYEVICADLHMHTSCSDATPSPRDRVIERWIQGFDAIAITDHWNCNAYNEALQIAESLRMILVPGLESGMRNDYEHYVVVGISSNYQLRDEHSWAEQPGEDTVYYRDRMRDIAQDGGLIIYAHPHRGMRESTEWGINNGIIQGIEVNNEGVARTPSSRNYWGAVECHGTWCYPFAFNWALEKNLAILSGSDIHEASGEHYRSCTLILVEERSPKGILDAVRDRRTIAWFGGMLWGREQLLSDLVHNTVCMRHTADRGVSSRLQVVNQGPVTLKGSFYLQDFQNRQEFRSGIVELSQYEEVIVEYGDAQGSVKINWENIWINPRENLVTTHCIQKPDSRCTVLA